MYTKKNTMFGSWWGEHGILSTSSTCPKLVYLGNSCSTYSFLNSEHVIRKLVIRPFFPYWDLFCFNNIFSQNRTLPVDTYVIAGLPHHVFIHPTHFSIRENELACHNSVIMFIIITGYLHYAFYFSSTMTSYLQKDGKLKADVVIEWWI